jgi:thiamine biosynthesis protein ThiS
VTIILNGERREIAGPMTVSALLDSLGVDARRVAVEHNLKVLKRAAFPEVQLREGDQVEVVNFVGGGAVGRR